MTLSLVLLPGLDGTGDLFEPFVSHLPEQIKPIIVRYPTHEVLDYSALTDMVLRHLPSDSPYVLLGESFSGPIAVQAASHRPAGLLGVVLCASFLSTPRPWLSRFARLISPHIAARLLGPRLLMGRFKSQSLDQRLRDALAKVSSRVLRARLRAVEQVDVIEQAAALEVPVLYLRASEDELIPRSAASIFERATRRGKVVVIEGPHCLLQCNPVDALRSIEELFHASSSTA